MARFAADGLNLDTRSPVTGGGRKDYSSAAGAVSLSNAYGTLRKKSPRYDQTAADGLDLRSAEEIAIDKLAAETHAKGIEAVGAVDAAYKQKKATEKAASIAQAAGKKSAMISGIGSIITAGIGLISDETTKNTIEQIEDACSILRDLKPVSFYYNEEWSMSPERLHYGFIAQEYQKVMPDATYYDEEYGKYCIDTGELISLLVRANQQLETRITRLEAKQALAGVK